MFPIDNSKHLSRLVQTGDKSRYIRSTWYNAAQQAAQASDDAGRLFCPAQPTRTRPDPRQKGYGASDLNAIFSNSYPVASSEYRHHCPCRPREDHAGRWIVEAIERFS